MMRLIAALLTVTLVSPVHAEAAGKKVVGAALVVAGGAFIAGAFDWGEQCPYLYTKHTFQGSATQCVFISPRGSDVQTADTRVEYKRPVLMWTGAGVALTGVVLLLLPKRAATIVDVSVTPAAVRASKTFRF